jgi:hypothetical protein
VRAVRPPVIANVSKRLKVLPRSRGSECGEACSVADANVDIDQELRRLEQVNSQFPPSRELSDRPFGSPRLRSHSREH